MTNEEQESERAQKLVRDAVNVLGEHFDSVQIFVSRHESGLDGGTTRHINMGTGNWFARFGQVRLWLVLEEEGTRSEVVRPFVNPDAP